MNYAGKNGWQGASSNVVTVVQRPLVTAGWYPTTITFGQSATISGATEADRVNAQVIVQVLHVDGIWRTATTGTTTATGTYGITFKPPWRGSFKYRVLVVGNTEFANGYSAERWLTAN